MTLSFSVVELIVQMVLGLRDLNGVPVEFLKIAPGGVVVIDIDGHQKLISQRRWDALPVWESLRESTFPRRYGPTREALVLALVGTLLILCGVSAGLIRSTAFAYTAVKRRIAGELYGAFGAACLAWSGYPTLLGS